MKDRDPEKQNTPIGGEHTKCLKFTKVSGCGTGTGNPTGHLREED
jgi:hypothetical protein